MNTMLHKYFLFACLSLYMMTGNRTLNRIDYPFTQRVEYTPGFFDSDDILEISLKGNIRTVLNDRSKKPKSYDVTLSYNKSDSLEINIPVKIKTRGHFRKMKENCSYPPLLIEFQNDSAQSASIFSEQKKMKLVMPCTGDEYIIREWLVYKIYNLVTPLSFRARLVKLTLDDDRNKKARNPFYAILLEEENQMAKRNNLLSIERNIKPQSAEPGSFLTMAVFQYLAGNTDWSVEYLQNIKLLAEEPNSIALTVPYDFDHAGIVEAPYARPAEELLLSSVRERRYRGYCVDDMKVFEDILAHFIVLHDAIYDLYTKCTLLNQKYIKSTIHYLDEFYETIKNPKAWQKDFAYPCDKNGTGNVVIKGLRDID